MSNSTAIIILSANNYVRVSLAGDIHRMIPAVYLSLSAYLPISEAVKEQRFEESNIYSGDPL